ncbi:MAG: LUD domain-containing protein [Acidobacteriaceae bacterium]
MAESGVARAAILDRIRNTNPAASTEKCIADYEAIPREYQRSAGMDRTAVLNLFAERLREYDARVYNATEVTGSTAILAALSAHDQKSSIVANGFPQQWLPEGLRWQMEADAGVEIMNKAEGAIVTCEVAIAHTGTIVLKGSRKLTLLPDRLLCVVREDQVVETVPEAFARLQTIAAEALTFISGPSATADIEMTRIRGVHGPRHLDVVLVSS